MIGDAALDPQPERAELARARSVHVDPNAGVARPRRGGHAVRVGRVGHGQLQGAHEGPQQDAALGEPDDGVRHELARPVVGDLTAALHADDLDAAPLELGGRGKDVPLRRVPPQRQDGLVLDEEQRIRRVTCRAGGHERSLPLPCVAVGQATEPLHREVHGGDGSTRICARQSAAVGGSWPVVRQGEEGSPACQSVTVCQATRCRKAASSSLIPKV